MFAAVLRRLFRRSACGRGPTRRGSARREEARWLQDAWAVRRRRQPRLRGGISLAAEGLEPRLALAAPDYSQTIDLVFNVPAATAALGLQIGVYSNTSDAYLDPTPVNGTYDFASYSTLSSQTTKLPLITVAAPGSPGGPVTLKVALDQEVVSGELIMFVGGVNTGLPYSSKTTSVSTPKSATNPAVPTTPDTFAQFEFNFSAVTNPGLDIDISSVDSTGFPFALVYPQSGTGAVGYPLNPLGITVSHQGLHDNFAGFLANQGSVNGSSVSDLFEQCATYVQQQDSSSLQVVAPGDILSNGTIGPTPGFQPASAKAIPPFATKANTSSTLAAGATYSYLVTAYSDNLIDGTQVYGETVPSVPITVTPLSAGQEIQITWTPYRDPNTAGYNVYRYASTDGVAPTDTTLYNLVGSVPGMLPGTGEYFAFTDAGLAPQATQISVATASPYGFNPLSEYYTQALKDFFRHYEAPGSFAINRDGVLWQGNTVEYAPTASWNTGGYTYRMLQLTAQNANAANTIPAGAVVNIYEPFFSTNTRFVTADAPPMPSWLQAGTSPLESPAEMVFGCDGVFASNTFDPDSFKSGKLQPVGDIENSIVSAFNRGIATTFYDAATKTGLVPDNWASFPNFTTPQTVDRTTPSNNLYYAVTAVNVYGETTASATVLAKQGSTLTWANGGNAAPAITYNVYAGTSPDQLYLQTTTSSPSIVAPAFTSQATAIPYRYFAPSSTSNFYAAYVSSDSLLDPVKGVSINGLSYGYAYSDQGGVSTNLFFSIDAMPPKVAINLGVPSGPGFVTQMLPMATVGSAYSATIVPSGTTSATFSVDPGTPLPSWATLAVNGTITGTPSGAGSWPFTVQATFNGVKNTQSYVLAATTPGAVSTPLSAAGVAAGVLALPQADVNLAYTAQVVPNGGAGGPYWLALDPTKTASLPNGISLPIGSGPIKSSNGAFTLTGTQTTAYPVAGISVVMSDQTAAVASASYGISTAQFVLASPGAGYKKGDQFPVTGGGGQNAAIVVQAVSSGTGAITQWGVLPGKGFTSATNLAVASTKSTTGNGASFTLASNPGTLFQPVVTIPNGGSGYSAAPNVTFYGSGSPQIFTAQLTGTAVTSVMGLTPTFTASSTPLLVSIDPPTPGASLPFTMNLTVNPPLAVTTTSLPAATVSQPYNQLLATNNAGTVTFSLTSGSLPAGLSLTPWGLITGTPTAVVTGQSFTVSVTDAAGGQTTQTFANGITVAATTSALAVTTTSLPATAPFEADGTTAVKYSANPFTTVTGGVAPYTYAVVNGSLPGLSLAATTGIISGTVDAQAAGAYPVTVRVTDAVGNQSFVGLTLDVLGITGVNGLPIDPSKLPSLRADATVLTLQGAGFDTTGSNNVVTLSSGTATVTAATATSLTLSISGPLTVGDLKATVKNALGTSTTVTVATVVAAQPVTVTPSAATASPFGSLTIVGTGFSTTPADNVVTLSSGTATVTAATATSLTLAFTSPPTAGSLLTATVTVEGVASAPTQVATIAAAAAKPTVNLSAAAILSGQTTLEITGTGFSLTPGETAVVLTQGDKKTPIPSTGLTVNSLTSLTLKGVSLGSYTGVIFATVAVNGIAAGPTQVGTGLGGSAVVVPPSPEGFAANGSVLVINGWGFTSSSTVTVTPQYSTGAGTPFTVTPQFDSSNRLVLTDLAIPATVLTFPQLPSGSNYTTAPNVTFSGGGASAGDQAAGYATIDTLNKVSGITVTKPGVYTSAPTVTFSGGQPTIAGTSAAGSGSGLGTITGLSTADANAAQAWLTTNGGKAAPFSGPGIPLVGSVITSVNTAAGSLDFAFPGTSKLTPQSGAAFSLGAPATTTVTLATLSSIQVSVSDPAIGTLPVAKALAAGTIAAPTVTGGTLVSNQAGGTLTINGTGFQTGGLIDVVLFTGPDAESLAPLDGFVATSDTGSGQQSVKVDSATQLSVTLAGPLPVGNVWAAVATAGVPMLGLGGPVVVATVAGPSLTTSTTSISSTPITLAIAGNGFATASGSVNAVTLFTGPDSGSLTPVAGAIVSVVATSSGNLQVTLDGAVPLPAGPLWATVMVDGTALGTAQIATVAATGQAPDITAATGGLAIAAPSLSIAGGGFSTTAGGNSVQLFTTAGPLGAPILVTATSPTALVVPLPPSLITAGPLYATVTTASGASAKEQVATVVAGSTPIVTPSTLRLAANAPQLVIAGTGFSTTAADNTVALSSGVAKVIAATATALTLQFTTPPTPGPLVATVTSNGLVGSATTVATVVAASTPTVTTSTAVLPTSAATLVITGSGFDTSPGGTNLVALSSGTVSKVTVDSPTQLTVTLGSALTADKLLATVTVDGVASTATQVATVGSTPVVTASSAFLGANAGLLTITGTGFSPVALNNMVTLSSGSGIVLAATAETLVLQFTQQPRAGLLRAVVVSDGIAGTQTQVATVSATVAPATGSLEAIAKTLTITGAGFDAATPANNVVALSSGMGTVTRATATSLTVTFTQAPTPGPLTATVVVDGISNPAVLPVQVATVVPGPVSAARSTLSAAAVTAAVQAPLSLVLQARDANGNPLATGGAKVTFKSSSQGSFSKVIDNGDGTYSATFTTSRVGAQTFSATVNRAKVASTATTGFVFASQFPGPSLAAPWSVRKGSFTPLFGTAFGGLGSTNIATYSGAVAKNATVSALVSNLAAGQFGGVVARYSSSTSHYRAGLVVEGGQTYAVIQAVGSKVKTLAKQAVASPGFVAFTVSGSTLTLTLDGLVVAQANDSRFTSGTVGISGGSNAGFGTFSAG